MKKFLSSLNLFTENEINNFLNLSKTISIKKGDFFIKNDQICESIAFVESGIFRSFYYSNNVDEITYCFTFPNNLLMAYTSFILQKKSEENIQALTDAKIISIPKAILEDLANSNSSWLRFFRIIAEREYVDLEKWIFNHQKNKAQQRYLDLLTTQPLYIEKIPLQYIASYLGITQRHLSRIRANITY